MPACSPSLSSSSCDLVAVLLGPAHVHAHQHLGPVLRLGAAGAGVDFDVAVVGVGLAGQQAFDLAPLRLVGQRAQRRRRLGDHRRVALGLGELDQFQRVGDIGFELAHALHRPASRLRSRISFCAAAASFHSVGSSARLFSSARRASATSQSKMPPQQRDRLLDLVVQGVGFGGHRSPHDPVRKARRQYSPPRLLSTPPRPAGGGPAGVVAAGPTRAGTPLPPSGDEAPGLWSGLNASVTVPLPLSQLRHRHPSGGGEGQHRPALQRLGHEIVPDRRGDRAAGLVVAKGGRLSKPTQTAVTRSGVKPANQASLKSWRGAGLAGDRAVEALARRARRCRAAPRPASS